jgi:CHAD domain-containing protein
MSPTTTVAKLKQAQPSVRDEGDRRWSEASAATLAELASKVRKRAVDVRRNVDVDAVHDMRTATRRLRTAITIYGEDADRGDREAVEDELRRVARRLGAVRDLDVLLEALGGHQGDPEGLEPLRVAWAGEREAGATRLKAEIGRGRFRRALAGVKQLTTLSGSDAGEGTAGGEVHRIADRAPALIWDAFGELLAFDIDPEVADPVVIHEMRIAAKKLRYTLEAFEDALEPGARLITEVTALQDAAGEMHDAIVAADRARSTMEADGVPRRERSAIGAFARAQERRAETRRPVIARCLAAVRGRPFRASLGRAISLMGHVSPTTERRRSTAV